MREDWVLRLAETEACDRPLGCLLGLFLTIFGFMLPAVALSVECTLRWCRDDFFDPLPTPWPVLLVAVVPVTHLLYLFGWRRKTRFLTGLATGVALLYTIPFIPMMPMAVLAIAFGGLGLLPLSPAL